MRDATQIEARSMTMTQQKQVALTVDRRGRQMAYRWGGYQEGGRWFRIGYDAAQLMISTGEARQVQPPRAATRAA